MRHLNNCRRNNFFFLFHSFSPGRTQHIYLYWFTLVCLFYMVQSGNDINNREIERTTHNFILVTQQNHETLFLFSVSINTQYFSIRVVQDGIYDSNNEAKWWQACTEQRRNGQSNIGHRLQRRRSSQIIRLVYRTFLNFWLQSFFYTMTFQKCLFVSV